jgi:hypothetical protein
LYFVLKAQTAFGGTGADESGTVVWGAALHLSQWIVKNAKAICSGKDVVELGCGCAIVSLCAAKVGATHVLVGLSELCFLSLTSSQTGAGHRLHGTGHLPSRLHEKIE